MAFEQTQDRWPVEMARAFEFGGNGGYGRVPVRRNETNSVLIKERSI